VLAAVTPPLVKFVVLPVTVMFITVTSAPTSDEIPPPEASTALPLIVEFAISPSA